MVYSGILMETIRSSLMVSNIFFRRAFFIIISSLYITCFWLLNMHPLIDNLIYYIVLENCFVSDFTLKWQPPSFWMSLFWMNITTLIFIDQIFYVVSRPRYHNFEILKCRFTLLTLMMQEHRDIRANSKRVHFEILLLFKITVFY